MQEPDACLEDDKDIDASDLLEVEEGKESLRKLHRGSLFLVVNGDFHFI